jgi:lipid II:glycine glycyltransferase (peptidoglycan interpeptide bridge formation enzyme)
VEFSEISKEAFATFSEKNAVSFLQTVAMGDLLISRGYEVKYFAVKEKDQILLAALATLLPIFAGKKLEINF